MLARYWLHLVAQFVGRATARVPAPRHTSPALTMITIPSLNSPILCEDYFDAYLV